MRRSHWIPLVLLLPAACAPPASEGGFDSPDPASRLYAIHRAGEAKDRAAIPSLVESLNSDDAATRMFAIQSLERITGERLDYNPYATLIERDAAIERWVAAVKTGEFKHAPDQR